MRVHVFYVANDDTIRLSERSSLFIFCSVQTQYIIVTQLLQIMLNHATHTTTMFTVTSDLVIVTLTWKIVGPICMYTQTRCANCWTRHSFLQVCVVFIYTLPITKVVWLFCNVVRFSEVCFYSKVFISSHIYTNSMGKFQFCKTYLKWVRFAR